MKINKEKLWQLMNKKFIDAGVNFKDAQIASDVLSWADSRGIHSHGAVRMEYYIERICKGGINLDSSMEPEITGTSTGIIHAENGFGFTAALKGIDLAIELAKNNGIGAVGISKMSHSGALGYYTEYVAKKGLIALTVCQSDPMAVPFGGSEPFFGTNPIAFAAPALDGDMFSLDMATTSQAWGKVLVARSKKAMIPLGWAVDEEGKQTQDPSKVHALLPIAGPKGYALMMMVDVLSGVLLGLPSGKNVSSMYTDMTKGRNLGQFHIVIDPEKFCGLEAFKSNLSNVLNSLRDSNPAEGYEKVLVPGDLSRICEVEYKKTGIHIEDEIYEYLIGDELDNDRYHGKNRFAE